MKLLVVSQYYWPETFGVNRLVRDLVAQGVDVTVLTGKPNYPSGKIQDGYTVFGTVAESVGGVKIFRVPLLPRGSRSGIRLILNYLSFAIFGLIFGPWLLRRQHFDAVFVYAPSPILQAIPAMLFSRIKNAPLAIWIQDLWPQSLSATGYVVNRFILWMVDLVVRWIYSSADVLLVQSQAFIEHVGKQAPAATPIYFFPNSAERLRKCHSDVSNPQVEKWTALMRSKFSVVFTGNVGTAQSMNTIIEAASLCSANQEICFFIVGFGSESQWLTREVEARGLKNIILTGWLPEEDMGTVLAAASVLLVLLLDNPIFYQTIPNKVQSYLAAGKPIIACLGGEGARVVAEARAGLICRPEDSQALAASVRELAEISEERLLQFGNNGQKYFDKHFESKMLSLSLIKLLSELANSSINSKT